MQQRVDYGRKMFVGLFHFLRIVLHNLIITLIRRSLNWALFRVPLHFSDLDHF